VSEVTHIIEAIERGEPNAAAELLPLVYGELRKLAASKMAGESPNQTLQPTALVHEAWMRLVGKENPQFANRAHFFSAAAEAMRRILIDNARRKRAERHGGGLEKVALDAIELSTPESDDQLLAIDEALEKLSTLHTLQAEVVKLRYFVGMTNAETAEALGISERTVKNYWSHARAWLFREINSA
jgi:RNA polymerase sigma factor (TIGR02999 family)